MPVGYHLNLEDGLITVDGTQAMDFTDLLELGHALLADPQFDPKLPQLVDLREMAIQQYRKIPTLFCDFVVNTFRPKVQSSIAVVVSDNLNTELLAHMYLFTCNRCKTELFDQYKLALKWLMRHEFADNLGLN